MRLTDRELDVMNVLWHHGPSTVAEVRHHLKDDLAYTTVLTILRTLESKGHVDHREEGKAHRYSPRVEEDAARQSALSRLLDRAFGGSAELLVTELVENRDLSPEEVRRLRALINRKLKQQERP